MTDTATDDQVADLDVDWYDSFSPHRGSDPELSVYSNLNGYLNSPADQEWFADVDRVEVGTVADEQLLVFRPAEDGRYALSRENYDRFGADVHITPAIKDTWGDPHLKETHYAPLHEQGDLIVADLSEIVDADETDETEPANGPAGEKVETEPAESGDSEDSDGPEDEVECEDCGDSFKNERGLKIHQGRYDDCGDTDEDDEVDGVAEVLQVIDDIETVQELATEIGETAGRARTLAKKAGCYGELQERPSRPGVDR